MPKHVVLFLAVLVVVCGSTRNLRELDNVQLCLSEAAGPCSKTSTHSRNCSTLVYDSMCLVTSIPAELALNVDKIACCFRCCLDFHINLYKLELGDDRRKLMSDKLSVAFPDMHGALKGYLDDYAVDKSLGILFSGLHSTLALSHNVVSGVAAAGPGPVQNIAILTGLQNMGMYSPLARPRRSDGCNKLRWKGLEASFATLVTPTLTVCTTDVSVDVLTTKSSVWFTSQLPCSIKSFANKTYGPRNALLHKAKVADWRSLVRVLPGGVRNPRALLDAANDHYHRERDIFLDCTCARRSHKHEPTGRMRAFLQAFDGLCATPTQLRALGPSSSISSRSNGSAYVPKLYDDWLNNSAAIRTYYASLRRSQFVLSLSTPDSLGHCEWEAVTSGAMVVMPAATFAELKANSLTWELYRSLPIAVVDTSQIDQNQPQQLEAQIRRASAAQETESRESLGSSRGIEVAFLHYWMHQFSQGLVRGKHSHFLSAFTSSVQQYVSSPEGSGHRKCPRSATGNTALAFAQDTRSRSPSLTHDSKNQNHHHHQQGLDAAGGVAFVVPVCCEGPSEIAWLQHIARLPDVSIHLYYKCPHCIPFRSWADKFSVPFSQTPLGALLLDNSLITNHINVHAQALYDVHSNGKEVTAYLTFITQSYGEASFPAYTFFLHAEPAVHLHFGLFFRAVTHALCSAQAQRQLSLSSVSSNSTATASTQTNGNTNMSIANAKANSKDDKLYTHMFLHLNHHWRSGKWGQCCGNQGACKRGLWRFLFGSEEVRATGSGVALAGPPSSAPMIVNGSNSSFTSNFSKEEEQLDRGEGNSSQSKGEGDEWWRPLMPGVVDKPRPRPKKVELRPLGASDTGRRERGREAENFGVQGGLRGQAQNQTQSHPKQNQSHPLSLEDQRRSRRRLLKTQDVLATKSDEVSFDVKFAAGSEDGWGQGWGFSTYNSAQFLISRDALLSLPRSFWNKLLAAINGTSPVPECLTSTTKSAWGGHQLTGQYERMWHVLFGYPRKQPYRSQDQQLPPALRVDCKPIVPGFCQEELGYHLGSTTGYLTYSDASSRQVLSKNLSSLAFNKAKAQIKVKAKARARGRAGSVNHSQIQEDPHLPPNTPPPLMRRRRHNRAEVGTDGKPKPKTLPSPKPKTKANAKFVSSATTENSGLPEGKISPHDLDRALRALKAKSAAKLKALQEQRRERNRREHMSP